MVHICQSYITLSAVTSQQLFMTSKQMAFFKLQLSQGNVATHFRWGRSLYYCTIIYIILLYYIIWQHIVVHCGWGLVGDGWGL